MSTKDDNPQPECFYVRNGKRQDRDIHEPILAGHHPEARQVGLQVAREHGLTEAEIAALYAPLEDEHKQNEIRQRVYAKHRARYVARIKQRRDSRRST